MGETVGDDRAIAIAEELADWDRRFFGDVQNLCLDCLPPGAREELVAARERVAARSPGPIGITGRYACAACGQVRRFLPDG
jgi:hypothetical protein